MKQKNVKHNGSYKLLLMLFALLILSCFKCKLLILYSIKFYLFVFIQVMQINAQKQRSLTKIMSNSTFSNSFLVQPA